MDKTNNSIPVVVLAAGGTGGHIFPAQALAEELLLRGIRVVLVTDKRFESYVKAFNGVEIQMIRSATLSGNTFKRIVALANIVMGIFQARRLLKKLRPVAVVGFGGYPSFPSVLAASWLKLYSLIHEQNAVLGRANRILAKWVTQIATSFSHTSHVPEEAKQKLIFTGNPVRAGVRRVRDIFYPPLEEDGALDIVVIGGSLGATVFSRVVPAALQLLTPAQRARIRLCQQCREADIAEVRKAYQAMDKEVELATFFSDVPERLQSAHLVIARAGASTVAELLTAGRPAILVPYPSAMDDHQTYNANTVEDAGGGWLMPEEGFTPEALAGKLEQFLTLPSALSEAAEKARSAGHPQAVTQLAALVLKHISQDDHQEKVAA